MYNERIVFECIITIYAYNKNFYKQVLNNFNLRKKSFYNIMHKLCCNINICINIIIII